MSSVDLTCHFCGNRYTCEHGLVPLWLAEHKHQPSLEEQAVRALEAAAYALRELQTGMQQMMRMTRHGE